MEQMQFNLSKREWMIIVLKGQLLCAIIGYLFYRSVLVIIFLCPFSYFYMKELKYAAIMKKKSEFNLQFRDAIRCISASLEAGYSVENAIKEAVKDLLLMYQEGDLIIIELKRMILQLSNHITVEEVLYTLALRTKDEDVQSFSEVFATAKRTGGDIIKIIRATSNAITDKVEINREIETLLSEKQLESNIMKMVPLGIVFYLQLTSPDMLSILYQSMFGRVFMSAMLLIYIVLCRWMKYIVSIKM